MNEIIKEETMASESSRPPVYRDRSPWLVFFGLMSVLIGIGFVVITLIAAVVPLDTESGSERRELLSDSLTNAIQGGTFIFLGVGSIGARRWARSLNLIFAWMWLATSVCTALVLALTLLPIFPQLIDLGKGIGPIELIPITLLAFLALIFCVVLPAGWILFFSRPSVRLTCESRNPAPSWTDACPLPVLGGSILLLVGALTFVDALVIGRDALPFFGTILVGRTAVVGQILGALILSWCAWGVYRSDRRVWWLALLVLGGIAVSCILSYSVYDVSEIYRLYNYKEISSIGVDLRRPYLVWISILFTLPLLIYIWYIGRFCPAER